MNADHESMQAKFMDIIEKCQQQDFELNKYKGLYHELHEFKICKETMEY